MGLLHYACLTILLVAPAGHARPGQGDPRCRGAHALPDGFESESATVGGVEFKLWMRKGNSNAAGARQAVVAAMNRVVPPMVADMGPPLGDVGTTDYGNTSALDLVLLAGPTDFYCAQNQGYGLDSADTLAKTNRAPKDPYGGGPPGSASGVMILNLNDVASPDFESTFAHEFFHVLQYAHNADLFDANSPHWVYESTATWAELHYVPSSATRLSLPLFAGFQQEVDDGLPEGRAANEFLNHYRSFLWWEYAVTERGVPAVTGLWDHLVGVTTPEDADAAARAVLPYDEHFRRFALRNLGELFGASRPAGPTWPDVDPLLARGGLPLSIDRPIADETPYPVPHDVPRLETQYVKMPIDGSLSSVRITPGLTPDGAWSGDVVWRSRRTGEWFTRRLPLPPPFLVCDASEVWLVVSNHSDVATTRVGGSVSVAGTDEPCVGTGWLSLNFHQNRQQNHTFSQDGVSVVRTQLDTLDDHVTLVRAADGTITAHDGRYRQFHRATEEMRAPGVATSIRNETTEDAVYDTDGARLEFDFEEGGRVQIGVELPDLRGTLTVTRFDSANPDSNGTTREEYFMDNPSWGPYQGPFRPGSGVIEGVDAHVNAEGMRITAQWQFFQDSP
jgi:hypothetical protein